MLGTGQKEKVGCGDNFQGNNWTSFKLFPSLFSVLFVVD
jgi:hypothetical protein